MAVRGSATIDAGSGPESAMMKGYMRRRPLSPARFLALSFLGVILLGAVLLALPLMTESGRGLRLVDALFTSTSAVCVTGLIVVDTPTTFSTGGEIVVLLLIQVGGLGYMTLSSLIALALGRRVSLQERLTLQEALNVQSLDDLLRFVLSVFKFTVAVELVGAVLLGWRFAGELGLVRGAYLGLFHSVSAFNNAGFTLFSTNLVAYRGDVVVNLVVTTLIICGGIGFIVLRELRHVHEKRLSLHVKMVLGMTGLLIVGATGAIFLIERANPATLGGLTTGEALLASYFQAVTPRTAGFNTVDIGALYHPTLFLLLALMFIGAAPGGTGGGVKVSTFAVTVLALWSTVRGVTEPAIFRRRIPLETVARSFFICLIAFLATNLVAGVLLVVEGRPLLPTLFEAVSAFGTVGLSLGQPGSVVSLAGQFSTPGKLLLVGMMFMGRVGPLTLAVAVARGGPRAPLRYPEGHVMIG